MDTLLYLQIKESDGDIFEEFSKDKIFTNLALLISDQCKHSIKVAVFGDIEKTKFKDTREFEGFIFNQLEETFNYLEFCNSTSAIFEGLERLEKKGLSG